MRIAICDDEADFVHTLYQHVWEEFDCDIDTFLNPEDLAKQYSDGIFYDIIFCDIIMEPYDGIALGRIIRSYDSHSLLIYLTSNLDYAPLGYEVAAFRYLLKPIREDQLQNVFQAIHLHLDSSHKLMVEADGSTILIPTQDILYLEVHDKETVISCEKETLYADKSLGELEQQLLQANFFRVHRKFLVNLNHIEEYDSLHITMDNGKTLPVSRRRSKLFQQAMLQFIKGEPSCY